MDFRTMNQNQNLLSPWRERYRVRIGFIFALVFLWRAQPRNLVLLVLGLLIALLGVLIRQWAAGCVKKMDELAQEGPYALVRHPLYLGSFLAASGFILSSSSFSFVLSKPYLDRTLFFWCFLWILVDSIYLPKILKEEADLNLKFKCSYTEYAERIPRFFPAQFKWSDLNFNTFNWVLWKKNKEFYSLIGYLIFCIILFSRYFF